MSPLGNKLAAARRGQEGVTTLAITLLLLVILTVMVLFSANVGFFEQRTTNNENRARLAEQAAEYALNLSGEYLKSNRDLLLAKTAGGWFEPGKGHWVKCSAAVPFANSSHPCMAERDNGAEATGSLTKVGGRRATLFFYTKDGTKDGSTALPYRDATPDAAELEFKGVGGTAAFATSTNVGALLCRVNAAALGFCGDTGNRVAIMLISGAGLTGEGANATVKEAWGSFSAFTPSAAVPLVASGMVTGKGNVTVVAAPNAGGYGVVGSIWAPSDVDIGNSSGTACGAGGLASVATCHMGEYLKKGGVARENVKDSVAGCAGNNKCDCPAVKDPTEFGYADSLSGHLTGGTRKEREDILDMDSDCGAPSITFFPSHTFDDDSDPTDDSLFEWVFGVGAHDIVPDDDASPVNTNCPGPANCAAYRLVEELGATKLADCSSINSSSSGIYYVTGNCTLGNDVNGEGSKDSPIIVVVDGAVDIKGLVYGQVFVRDDDNDGSVKVTGNGQIFGALIVEGDVEIGGNLTIVYDDASVGSDPDKIPKTAKFGRLPGSWLDSNRGIGATP